MHDTPKSVTFPPPPSNHRMLSLGSENGVELKGVLLCFVLKAERGTDKQRDRWKERRGAGEGLWQRPS